MYRRTLWHVWCFMSHVIYASIMSSIMSNFKKITIITLKIRIFEFLAPHNTHPRSPHPPSPNSSLFNPFIWNLKLIYCYQQTNKKIILKDNNNITYRISLIFLNQGNHSNKYYNNSTAIYCRKYPIQWSENSPNLQTAFWIVSK